jgi:hypothetical protein
VTDKYKADCLVDKSTDRSVWIRMGKTKDRSAVFDQYGKATKIGLGRPIVRILKVSPSLIHRLYAVDVGQNKRTVSAVADTRKVTIVSANQLMVEVSTDSCHTGTS